MRGGVFPKRLRVPVCQVFGPLMIALQEARAGDVGGGIDLPLTIGSAARCPVFHGVADRKGRRSRLQREIRPCARCSGQQTGLEV